MPIRIWLLLAATFLVPSGLLWYLHDQELLAKAQSRAEQLARDFDARPSVRPALGGVNGGVNGGGTAAWTCYLEAMAIPEGEEDRFARAAALLRAGAQCPDSRYPGARLWDGFEMAAPDVIVSMDLGRGVLRHADSLRQEGRAPEALRAELDVAVFGRDLADCGSLVSWCVGNILVGEAMAQIATAPLGQLPRAAAWSLAVELEQLEDALPSVTLPLQGELAAATFGAPQLLRGMDWSSPERLLFAVIGGTTLAEHQELLTDLAATEAMPWRAAEARAQAVADEVRSSLNPLLRLMSMGNGPQFVQCGRSTLARVRALRVVLNWSVCGKRLHLADPFGDGPLAIDVGADGVIRCSSRGPGDGVPLEVVLH